MLTVIIVVLTRRQQSLAPDPHHCGVGYRFQALAAGNPMEVREEKIAVKVTYSWSR